MVVLRALVLRQEPAVVQLAQQGQQELLELQAQQDRLEQLETLEAQGQLDLLELQAQQDRLEQQDQVVHKVML